MTARTHPKPRWRLAPWQYQFALWWTMQADTPSTGEQERVATELANARTPEGEPRVAITYRQIERMKRRADWRQYVEAAVQGGLEAARARLVADLPTYMDLHLWGALEAKARGDIRALPAFTTPALERAWPRREGPQIQTQVNVVLSAAQLNALKAPPVVVSAERVPEAELDEAPRAPMLPAPHPDARTWENAKRSRTIESPAEGEGPMPWDTPFPDGGRR